MSRSLQKTMIVLSIIVLILVSSTVFFLSKEHKKTSELRLQIEKIRTEATNVVLYSKDISNVIKSIYLLPDYKGYTGTEGLIQQTNQSFFELTELLHNSVGHKAILDDLNKAITHHHYLALNLLSKTVTPKSTNFLSLIKEEAVAVNVITLLTDDILNEEENEFQRKIITQDDLRIIITVGLIMLVVLTTLLIGFLITKDFILDKENQKYSTKISRQTTIINNDKKVVGNLESLLQSVLDCSIQGTMGFDSVRNDEGEISDFKFNTVNKRACEIVNMLEKELVGNMLLDKIPGNKEAGLFDKYVRVVETGESLRLIKFYDYDGFKTWFEISAIKNGDGFVVTFTDITENKNNETQLLLAERLSMTGKIARSIAHEIRNPLTNLNLALEELKTEHNNENEEALLYFDIIERNSKRISQLLTEMLNSSKRKVLEKTRYSVNKLVEDAIKFVEDRFSLKRIVLNNEPLKDDEYILIDVHHFIPALVNIMINAVEAMEEDKGVLNIQLRTSESSIAIQIQDNGIGISEENLTKLYDPFFTQKQGGMGLGLTSTQNIIYNNGGSVMVSSKLGKGTTFVVSLPKA